ncbi:MAG: hypothetical protein RLO01_12580 [Thalassobaculaceae bacterium]
MTRRLAILVALAAALAGCSPGALFTVGFTVAGGAVDLYCDRVAEEAKQRVRDRHTSGRQILRCDGPSSAAHTSGDPAGADAHTGVTKPLTGAVKGG